MIEIRPGTLSDSIPPWLVKAHPKALSLESWSVFGDVFGFPYSVSEALILFSVMAISWVDTVEGTVAEH